MPTSGHHRGEEAAPRPPSPELDATSLTRLLDAASEAMIIVDRRGAVVRINAACERLFGWSQAELAGQPIERLVPAALRGPHVAYREAYLAAPTSRPMAGRSELFGEHKDGSPIPVSIGLSYARQGDELLVLAVVLDARELRRAQRALVDSAGQLEALHHAFPDSSLRVDAVNVVTAVQQGSAPCLLGAPEALLRRPLRDIVPPEGRDALLGAVEATRRHRAAAAPVELALPGATLEARVVPLPERDVLVIVRDITEKKKNEGLLVQATKLAAIGTLAGNIAHEINNPMGIISAKVRLLLTDPRHPLPEKVQRDLQRVVDQCDRIGALTRGLLDFARPSEAERAPLAPIEPLEKALAMVAGRNMKARVEVVRELPADLPPVVGSQNELQQVFLNLLINAVDAMPQGGRITVRARRATLPGGRSAVAIDIEDTGPGIPPHVRARMFEPFFTTKSAVVGTGLGLAIVLGLVQAHDGTIDVESEPGRGARFTVTLPAAP